MSVENTKKSAIRLPLLLDAVRSVEYSVQRRWPTRWHLIFNDVYYPVLQRKQYWMQCCCAARCTEHGQLYQYTHKWWHQLSLLLAHKQLSWNTTLRRTTRIEFPFLIYVWHFVLLVILLPGQHLLQLLLVVINSGFKVQWWLQLQQSCPTDKLRMKTETTVTILQQNNNRLLT